MTTVVFLVAPHVQLLDLAGPAQVLSAATELGAEYRLRFVGSAAPVTSSQGLPLLVEGTLPRLGGDDWLLVPGWGVRRAGRAVNLSTELLDALADHHRRGGLVGSICAGAFALGAAGLLDGRRCTTHHELHEDLQRRYPLAQVERDRLWVQDGTLITSAGIASGIDLALELVAQYQGPALAARVARSLVVFGRRNGDASQLNAMLRHRDHLRESVHRAQNLIDGEFARALPLREIAAAAGVSPRTLTRAFVETIGMTPLRYQQVLRVERAEAMLSQGATMESAARSVGFEDARMLRRLRNRPDSGADRSG